MFTVSEESKSDWWEVEALYDLCFGPGREALSSYRLREGIEAVAELCLIVRDAESIISGAIRYWPISVGDQVALLLGPIAIHPTHQGEGLGALLIRESLDIAQNCGWRRVLLVGDIPYYSRFGFLKNTNVTMPPPTNPDRVLTKDLEIGAWDGITGIVSPFRSMCHPFEIVP